MEETIAIKVIYGYSECRSWFEAEMLPGGYLRLIGMGSLTSYDREGKITAHNCEPTGLNLLLRVAFCL